MRLKEGQPFVRKWKLFLSSLFKFFSFEMEETTELHEAIIFQSPSALVAKRGRTKEARCTSLV